MTRLDEESLRELGRAAEEERKCQHQNVLCLTVNPPIFACSDCGARQDRETKRWIDGRHNEDFGKTEEGKL